MPHDDCYYCEGDGMIDSETCPRCGGTGLARNDD
ncbi:30S ribosomal protein S27ae [Candidatus Thorarchaeota archaeon]|nr:MAG: 30S ribosomal protein S27ae [Candidatus Thorarchaeota archaeon]